MPTPDIIQRAKDLHREVGDRDPALRADLDRVIAAPQERQHYSSLGDRLRAAVTAWKVDHPGLAGAAQGLIDELVAAGL